MALAPKPVNTRKRALLANLGYDPDVVVDDGSFDEEGFTILEWRPEEGEVSAGSGEFPRTRIKWWTAELRQRAVEARDGDFYEMVGMTPEQWFLSVAPLREYVEGDDE